MTLFETLLSESPAISRGEIAHVAWLAENHLQAHLPTVALPLPLLIRMIKALSALPEDQSPAEEVSGAVAAAG